MNISQYTILNSISMLLLLFFVFATGYLWRDVLTKEHASTAALQHREGSRERVIESSSPYEGGGRGGSTRETNPSSTTTKQQNSTTTMQQNEQSNTAVERSDHQVRPNNAADTNSQENSGDDVVLPPSLTLAVPFTSQAPEKDWSQPWQDACEEAAILMLDAYYKQYNLSPLFARDEILKLVNWEEAPTRDWGRSIPMTQVVALTEHLMGDSVQVRMIENPSIEQIKRELVADRPVLVVADGKTLDNPHFQNGGPVYHALVIRGYDEDGFITNDPGTQFGENFHYSYENLMASIHDYNGGDVPNGRSVVLVVERVQ